MATPLICLKISPENVKQLSVKTSPAKRSNVSVEGSLTMRWSKKYVAYVCHLMIRLTSTCTPPFGKSVTQVTVWLKRGSRYIGFAFANIYLMSKTKDQTYLNPWLDISIFRATRTNTWKFAEFIYTLGTMKLEKGKNRD